MKIAATIKPITLRLSLASMLLLASLHCQAEVINIAVASNFAQTMHKLVDAFENKTKHQIRMSSASTGKLYTQINHGAPFDIFLAADEKRPDLLINENMADASMSRTYALGKLALLSNIKPDGDCKDILQSSALKRLAIANPKTAPYGAAAKQVLEHLGQWKNLKSRLAMGENIAQTLQFVSTGSANAGFVAKSMLLQGSNISSACEWDIPADMYSPIKQKMVVLKKAASKQSAKDFWAFMQSEEATQIIKNNGYDVL